MYMYTKCCHQCASDVTRLVLAERVAGDVVVQLMVDLSLCVSYHLS